MKIEGDIPYRKAEVSRIKIRSSFYTSASIKAGMERHRDVNWSEIVRQVIESTIERLDKEAAKTK